MDDLRDLYQEVIIDHGRRPRNFGAPATAGRLARGHNPLCGDELTVFLNLDGDTISEVRFEGTGCAISVASASLMSENLKGKTLAEFEKIYGNFHHMVTEDEGAEARAADLGKLGVLAGVREFPARVKCATLAWHTLHAAVHGEDLATTE